MRAYIFDESPGDQRLAHDSGRDVTAKELYDLGVLYYHLPSVESIDSLAENRGYKNRDEIIVSPEKMGAAYDDKVKTFFDEHLHEDEEIRYICDGQGYFDVRNKEDAWIRIKLEKGDLLVLPAGIYHRFTPDEHNYVHALRLFKDEPMWKSLNRCAELNMNVYRKDYVKQFLSHGPEQCEN